MTDAETARLVNASYDPKSSWDHWFDGSGTAGIRAGIKDNNLVFPGSETAEDWYRDLLAFPDKPLNHEQLGPVHFGFYLGLDAFLEKALPLLGDSPHFCGHSLGASRAWLAAGVYIAKGGHPGGITAFGSPRPGCSILRQLLAPYPKSSYRNGEDPVTDVPVWLASFPVLEPTPFKLVNVAPVDSGLLRFHHMPLYVQGTESLTWS